MQRCLEKLRDDTAECAVIGGLAETKERANCSLGSQSLTTPFIKTEGLQIWGTAEKRKEYRHIGNRWRSLAEGPGGYLTY
jgi:hypothetical protein